MKSQLEGLEQSSDLKIPTTAPEITLGFVNIMGQSAPPFDVVAMCFDCPLLLQRRRVEMFNGQNLGA